jgi:TM2 domain-containing membrane protein YozV
MRYSLPVAYFLWLISGCGALGFHRFYLGKKGTGLLWFFTGGLGMVGAVYDFITMQRQVTEANMREDYRLALGMQARGYLPSRVDLPNRPESIEKVILRAARKNGGAITPGEVALEGDVELDAAKKALDKLAAAGHAEMRIRSSGVVVYVFPEFARDGANDYID